MRSPGGFIHGLYRWWNGRSFGRCFSPARGFKPRRRQSWESTGTRCTRRSQSTVWRVMCGEPVAGQPAQANQSLQRGKSSEGVGGRYDAHDPRTGRNDCSGMKEGKRGSCEIWAKHGKRRGLFYSTVRETSYNGWGGSGPACGPGFPRAIPSD